MASKKKKPQQLAKASTEAAARSKALVAQSKAKPLRKPLA